MKMPMLTHKSVATLKKKIYKKKSILLIVFGNTKMLSAVNELEKKKKSKRNTHDRATKTHVQTMAERGRTVRNHL